MSECSVLNSRFGITGLVTFKEAASGLIVIEVANAHATATLSLQGAHLMTWIPRGSHPVIWLSPEAKVVPGKSIRGGIPICWPWFGAHPDRPDFPAHGFARTLPWEIVNTEMLPDGATRLVFRFVENEVSHAQWPYPSEVECHITIGARLELDLVTINTGRAPITIGQALHTYFEVSDIRQVSIDGLDQCQYLDKVGPSATRQQSGPVTIASEVDRIYVDTTADCVINDPGLNRRIRISKQGSHSTVVWNPWIEKANKMGDLGDDGYLRMVCVESTNAADDVVNIAPGAVNHLWVRYQVEPLQD